MFYLNSRTSVIWHTETKINREKRRQGQTQNQIRSCSLRACDVSGEGDVPAQDAPGSEEGSVDGRLSDIYYDGRMHSVTMIGGCYCRQMDRHRGSLTMKVGLQKVSIAEAEEWRL